MCTDTLYFMWTIYKTGYCNIQYYVIYLAEHDLWIRLQNILYHICFDNRVSLPGGGDNNDDDDDDDDNDTGDISTCDMQAKDNEVAEMFREQVTW